MSHFVLDACALLAMLRNETGADKVAKVINAANNDEAKIEMNKVNLLEVYYDLYRSIGKDLAEKILVEIKNRPITIISDFTDDLFAEAGRMKATYKISLADSFALAQAIVSDGALLTSDHHEFEAAEQSENIMFDWIR
jgi:PIN domain nuclease of toxin-antitoxin system